MGNLTFLEREILNKVYNSGNASLQVDIVDATGVTFVANSESVYVDDGDWTDSTSKHTLVGGLYQSTPQTITDGDVGPLQVNSNGFVKTSNDTIDKMLYGTGLVITAVHAGSDQALGSTYQSLYVGVGGDVVVTLATSGSDFTFKNVASGQLLPIQITHVKASNTTATNMIALKA